MTEVRAGQLCRANRARLRLHAIDAVTTLDKPLSATTTVVRPVFNPPVNVTNPITFQRLAAIAAINSDNMRGRPNLSQLGSPWSASVDVQSNLFVARDFAV